MQFLPKVKIAAALVAGLLVGLNGSVGAITIAHNGDSVDIEFVDIGYAGNTGDGAYGAVDYEYSIGKYEVTADQWAAVIAASSTVDTGSHPDYYTGSQPTSEVSWYEAVKFTNWLTSGDALLGAYQFSDPYTFTGIDRDAALITYGKIYVLPTEDEWFKAAYLKSDGSGYTLYATGDDIPIEGVDTNYGGINFDPWIVGSGSEENNGTYDMEGNMREWTEGAHDGLLDDFSEARLLRGGGRFSTTNLFRQRASKLPQFEQFSVGFRIASIAVPEPTSTALLALGGVAVMMRRRR